MADTEARPTTNGSNGDGGGGGGDSDDEQVSLAIPHKKNLFLITKFQKKKINLLFFSSHQQVPRPVNIEQDVREMERRKRVDAIMSSKLFREELEKVSSNDNNSSYCDYLANFYSN